MKGKHSLGKAGLIIFCALLCAALVNPAGAACPVSWRDKSLTYTRACTMIDAFDNLSQVDPWMVSNISHALWSEYLNRTSDYNSVLISDALNRSVDKAAIILEMENQQAANLTHTENEIYIGTDKNISEGKAAVLATVSDWIQDPANKTAPYSPTGTPGAYNVSPLAPTIYDVNGSFSCGPGCGALIMNGVDFGIQPNATITISGLYIRARMMSPPFSCDAPYNNTFQWKIWQSPPSGPVTLLGNTSACDIPFGSGDENQSWVGIQFDHPITVTPNDIVGFHNAYSPIAISTLLADVYYDNYLPYYGDFSPGGFIYLNQFAPDVVISPEIVDISARVAEDIAAVGDASTLSAAKGVDEHITYDVDGTEAQIVSTMPDFGFSFNESQEISELYVRMKLSSAPFSCEISDDSNLTWKVWKPYGTDPIILGNTSACDMPHSNNATAWVGLKFNRTLSITLNDIVGFTKGGFVPTLTGTTKPLWEYYPDNLPWTGNFYNGGFPSKSLVMFAPDVTNKLEVVTTWPIPAAASAKNAAMIGSAANHTPLLYDARGTGMITFDDGGNVWGFKPNASMTLDSLYVRGRLTSEPGSCDTSAIPGNLTLKVWRNAPSEGEILGNISPCSLPFGPLNDTVWIGARFDHAISITPNDIVGLYPGFSMIEGPYVWSAAFGGPDYPDRTDYAGDMTFNPLPAAFLPDLTTRPEIEWQAEARESRIVDGGASNLSHSVDGAASNLSHKVDAGAANLSHSVDGAGANLTAAINQIRGNGTVTYFNSTPEPWINLTTIWTEINGYGSTQGLNFTTPGEGHYLVEADIRETMNTANTPTSTYALCDATGTDPVAGTERMGLIYFTGAIPMGQTHHFSWLYTNLTGATQVKVCGKLDVEPDGNWTVASDENGRSVLNWMRLT